jgi:bacillithiol system protein YtxJ
MGIFNKIFGGSSEPKQEKALPWQSLMQVSQLSEIEKRSQTKPQFIFKHSTRCGISRMVMQQFVAQYNIDINADLYYLDLLNYRDVSNEVGYKFQVMHQSPQLLIIKNGIAVAHASHGAINEMDVERFV